MGFINRCFNFSKRFIREKENIIRAENIVSNEEWKKYTKFIGKGYEWYIITPTNYEYCKCIFNLKIGKEEFKKLLKERIKFLKENNENIQLSIFLCKVKKFLNNQLQEEKFSEAFEFLQEMNLRPNKFFPIDMIFNKYTLKLAKKYGLKELTDFNLFITNPVLKIIKYFGIKLSFINEIYIYIKKGDFKSVFQLILGELKNPKEKTLHAEILVRDEVWNSLKEKIIGKNFIWFIITPTDYDYCKTYFNLTIDKEKFSKVLKDRIKFLKDKNEEIQLHIHLGMFKRILDHEFQEQKFNEAIAFMNALNIKPKKFAPGWWIYNKKTLEIAKKCNIEEIFEYNINPKLKKEKINKLQIKYVHKYWHDFDFL